ncbi:MAG: hypothetical protein U0105_07545 [Candidatus Obscuribacterales bacterium]
MPDFLISSVAVDVHATRSVCYGQETGHRRLPVWQVDFVDLAASQFGAVENFASSERA